jgi:hypothetical protein
MPSPNVSTIPRSVKRSTSMSMRHSRCKPSSGKMQVSRRAAGIIKSILAEHETFIFTAEEGLDLLAVVLRSPEPPCLDRSQMQRVMRANKAYLAYKKRRDALDDSDDDEGPDNDDAWLFEDLNVLMKLMVRKREKEQLLALIFEVSLNRCVICGIDRS